MKEEGKKKGRIEDRTQEKKGGKEKKGQKVWLWVPPSVFNYKKMPLSYELWKLKTAKMCFQFL